MIIVKNYYKNIKINQNYLKIYKLFLQKMKKLSYNNNKKNRDNNNSMNKN